MSGSRHAVPSHARLCTDRERRRGARRAGLRPGDQDRGGDRDRRAPGARRRAQGHQGRARRSRLRGRPQPQIRVRERPGQSGDGGADRAQIRRRRAGRDRADLDAVGPGGGRRDQGNPGRVHRGDRSGRRQAGVQPDAAGRQRHRHVRSVADRPAPRPDQPDRAGDQAARRDLQSGRGQLGDAGRAGQKGGAGARARDRRGAGAALGRRAGRRAEPGRQGRRDLRADRQHRGHGARGGGQGRHRQPAAGLCRRHRFGAARRDRRARLQLLRPRPADRPDRPARAAGRESRRHSGRGRARPPSCTSIPAPPRRWA